MQNDAKLGFLAGVAGVVTAAVLFYQTPPPTTSQATPTPAAVAAPHAAGVVVPAGSAAPPSAVARVEVPAGRGASGGRKELDVRTVSRTTPDDD